MRAARDAKAAGLPSLQVVALPYTSSPITGGHTARHLQMLACVSQQDADGDLRSGLKRMLRLDEMGGHVGDSDQQAQSSGRGKTPAARSRWTFALIGGLLMLAGSIFCAPVLDAMAVAPSAFVLFMACLAAITASALVLRHSWSDHPGQTARHKLPRELLADLVFTCALTVAFMKLCEFSFGHAPPVSEYAESFLYIGLVASFDRLLRRAPVPLTATDGQPSPAATLPATPVSVADELHYVEAEDHYVKFVYRDRVEHKRARFSDVISGLGTSGHRVHKSFWVSCRAVRGSRRAGRQLVLVLHDGTEIPVGRGNERMVADILAARNGGIRANSSAPRS